MNNGDHDEELSEIIGKILSLLKKSTSGQKRRRLGHLSGVITAQSLLCGIPGEVMHEQLLRIIESAKP